MTKLDPGGHPVRVGSITLRTPGLIGEANVRPPGTERTLGPRLASDHLETALRNTESRCDFHTTLDDPDEPFYEVDFKG
jgi:hypothetical protein